MGQAVAKFEWHSFRRFIVFTVETLNSRGGDGMPPNA